MKNRTILERLKNHLQNIREESEDLQILRSISGKDFNKNSVWAKFLNAIISCLTTGKFIPKPELTKVSMKYYTDEIDYLIYHKDDDERDLEGVLKRLGMIKDDWTEGIPGTLIPDIISDYEDKLSPSIIKELNKASDFLDSLGDKLYPKAIQYAKTKWKELEY